MKEKKTIYYSNELEDEFSKAKIKTKLIDEKYNYLRKEKLWGIKHFFWYRLVATPMAYLYCKLKFRYKIINKHKLRNIKTGFFLYGNHTQDISDACMPSLACIPNDVYVIVHPNNVSMPVLGKVTPYLGALPLPSNIASTKNFLEAVETRIKENCCVMIYPEAHIWPYYTKIRPFLDNSFKYPIKYDVPCFCMTTTYQSKRHKPVITVYIDGPFYSNKDLSLKEQQVDLRNQIYNTMVMRSKNSTFEYIKYVKEDNK